MNQSGQPFLVNVILVVASRLLLSTTFMYNCDLWV